MRREALFRDREEATEQLARHLARHRGKHPLVLGIPRGGVVLADILADRLEGDLDILLVRKLRAPDHPELAIGSITERGQVTLNEQTAGIATRSYLQEEAWEAFDLMRRRREFYTPDRPPVDPKGRLVIVVDDGIATGATMIAALRSLRDSQAERIIAAAAVAPAMTVQELRREADDVLCLARPDPFHAVSHYFEDFREVTDEEVSDLLRRHSPHPS